jgi:uncharacterized protein HemX
MSNQQEATVNADGSQTFGSEPPLDQEPVDEGFAEEILKEAVKGIDPAFYLLIAVAIALALYYFLVMQKKKTQQDDDFFSNLDGEKVSVLYTFTPMNVAAGFVCVCLGCIKRIL